MPTERPAFWGDVLVLLAMLMFGSYAIFLRWFPDIPVLLFLFSFQLVGLIGFGGILSAQRMLPRVTYHAALLLCLLAFVAVGNDLTYFFAFRLTTVANAAVAHQMVSVFLLFFAPYFLQEKIKKSEWVSFSISLLGIGILYKNGLELENVKDLWGIDLALCSALCYAVLILCYRSLGKNGLTIPVINFWRYLLSTMLLIPVVYTQISFAEISSDFVVPLLLFGLLFGVIASGIHNFAITKTRALHVSIIGKSEPVIATLYAFLIFKEIPALETIIGGVCIIGASLYLAIKKETI